VRLGEEKLAAEEKGGLEGLEERRWRRLETEEKKVTASGKNSSNPPASVVVARYADGLWMCKDRSPKPPKRTGIKACSLAEIKGESSARLSPSS
jgi:hypothetical protein